jgi:hypothetical protein
MRPLAEINDPLVLMSGMYPSLPANQQAFWRSGKNVFFADARVSKFLGVSEEEETADAIYAIEQANVDGARRVYYARAASVHKNEFGVASQLGSGFQGSGYWSMTTWGTWLIATNDYDAVKVWKNTGSMVSLANVRVPRARLVKKFKNHVLLFYGQAVDWSHESDPETWVPAPENKAGRIPFRDLDSDIRAVQPLAGSALAVYTADSMVLLQWVGSPFIFGTPTPAINGIGAVSDSAVVPVGQEHFGLSRKGFFRTDGIGFSYIDSPAVKKLLLSEIDWDNSRRVVGVHHESNQTVEWYYPKLDGTIGGLAYRYAVPSGWMVMDLPITAVAEQQVFDAPLYGVKRADATGFWGYHSSGEGLGGEAFEASIRSFPITAGNRERFKDWAMLRVDKESSINGLEFRLGFSDDLEADPAVEPAWTSWASLSYENWIHRSSVNLTLEFRSTTLEAEWSLCGFSLHGELGGYL